MGPIALFDKSFLQSLSLDEAVWFDQFFIANVCPLFYVETLADLEKDVSEERSAEREVSVIARKFPEMHGEPCMIHTELCVRNLLGEPVGETGAIPCRGGRAVKAGGRVGMVYDYAPEAEAFSRWQEREFLEIERLYAKDWRKALADLDLNRAADAFRKLGITPKSCRSLQEAKSLAMSVVTGHEHPFDRIRLAFAFLDVPEEHKREIVEQWSLRGYESLQKLAPYAAHVLAVELFFQIALAANLIGTERTSNRVDIAYFFYAPFAHLFISSDRLHQKCAQYLLGSRSRFVWGSDLKSDLRRVNEHFLGYSESRRQEALSSFAKHPPPGTLVAELWSECLGTWPDTENSGPIEDQVLLDDLQHILAAEAAPPEDALPGQEMVDAVVVRRRVQRMRGSWWQIPKDYQ